MRTAESTWSDLVEQLCLASRGVEKPVKEHQTMSGTKDKILQHWMPSILAKSKELKAERRAVLRKKDKQAVLGKDDLQAIEISVLEWAQGLSTPLFSPLLSVDGTPKLFDAGSLSVGALISFILCDRPEPKWRHTGRNPPHLLTGK